ncbi:MAG: hypothetical protein ACM3VZ_00620 [Acidobacteriota bacterium]
MTSSVWRTFDGAKHATRMLQACASVALVIGTAGAQTLPRVERSASEWVRCGGVVDGTAGFAKAIDAAKLGAFTLVVDCPILLHIGEDIGKPIFIDDGTSVRFGPQGKLIVDNVFVPAFVIANASHVNLVDWRVEYRGQLPIDPQRDGYINNGQFVAYPGPARPAYAFNDITLKDWLVRHKGVTFQSANPWWTGPISAMAVFHIRGSTDHLSVRGMQLTVPQAAGGHQFIPVAFSFIPGPRSGLTIASDTPFHETSYAVPHQLTFCNIVLDGTYMGWLGNVQDTTFSAVRSYRYGDLQDASGGTVGGVGKWFPPPHLFYLNYDTTQSAGLFNRNLTLTQTEDRGPRIGVARDLSASEPRSGYANSLKIGGNNIMVDGYSSHRPDGFLDLLPSDGLTIKGLHGQYDSNFLHGLYPGIRFPATDYRNILIADSSISDAASGSGATIQPVGGAGPNDNIHITGLSVAIGRWALNDYRRLEESALRIYGTHHRVDLTYTIGGQVTVRSGRVDDITWQMRALPSFTLAGSFSTLSWSVANAWSCNASSGTWTAQGLSGSQQVTFASEGTITYGLLCTAGSADAPQWVSPSVPVTYGAPR